MAGEGGATVMAKDNQWARAGFDLKQMAALAGKFPIGTRVKYVGTQGVVSHQGKIAMVVWYVDANGLVLQFEDGSTGTSTSVRASRCSSLGSPANLADLPALAGWRSEPAMIVREPVSLFFGVLLLSIALGACLEPRKPPVTLHDVEIEIAIARDPVGAADVLLVDLERLTRPSPSP
jgi:hypothetical protein